MEKYLDSNLPAKARVADLLSKMTVEEKAAQLTQFMGKKSYVIKDNKVSVSEDFSACLTGNGIGLLYGVQRADIFAEVEENNNLSPLQAGELVNLIQKANIENSRFGIPLLFAEECTHGLMAYGAVVYPVPIGMGCTFNVDLYGRMCRAIAAEARARGVLITYSPVLEALRDVRWGRAEECYSEDVYLCTQMGLQGLKQLENNDISSDDAIVAAVKHFAVHGCPEGGINIAYTSVGDRELHETWLYPFKKAVEAGVKSIITSYNEIDGVPMCANKSLIKGIVKDEWGFSGFIFSDLGAVELLADVYHVAKDYKEATFISFDTGIDIDMMGISYNKYLIELVKEGKITEKELDDSVARILKIKFDMGLFERPYVDVKKILKTSRTSEAVNMAREAARESIVMLKNKNNILPLPKDISSVAVIGPNADNVYNQLGDYTAWQNRDNVVTILDGIKNVASNVNYAKGCRIREVSDAGFAEAIEAARKSDVVVAVMGGSSNRFTSQDSVDINTGQAKIMDSSVSDMETGEGVDRMSLELLGSQRDLLIELKKTGKPIVVIYICGRPISDPWVDENADVILCAWYPGEQGGNAVADILFGDYSPSGKLTVSIPKHVGQIPVHYNKHLSVKTFSGFGYVEMDVEPAYPFGYGLSYTNFEYSNLFIDKEVSKIDEAVIIKFDVKNVGNVKGAEAVQLYIKDVLSSVARPPMELKGFAKVELESGQKKTVELVLTKDELEILDINKNWIVEPGEFEVMVGASSKDIKLKGKLIKK